MPIVAMFGGVGQGGIPVWRIFPQLADHLDHLDGDRHRSSAWPAAMPSPATASSGKSGVFLGLMLTRTVPGIALSLPLFFVYARLGIIDTHFGLILVYVALNVPFTDLADRRLLPAGAEGSGGSRADRWLHALAGVLAGRVSAGRARASRRPASSPSSPRWNEFALASQLTRSVNSKTLPVGLLDYTAEFTIDWRGMCALAVVMIIPALTLTFIVQKHLVSGLTSGAVKG